MHVPNAQEDSLEQKSVWSVDDFDTKGDGITLNRLAFQKTIDECAEPGGGKEKAIIGLLHDRHFFLKSKVELLKIDAELNRC